MYASAVAETGFAITPVATELPLLLITPSVCPVSLYPYCVIFFQELKKNAPTTAIIRSTRITEAVINFPFFIK